ncbi:MULTISPECIES: ectoine/hydroxyectoine ABC transporter permease subunit EhuD [Amycolatopsis]|uniref:Ectoine/hydroxyectoine ABC transporter permease subunit EhuD n=1 Tax=Amycolatopsis thermalba TaxID=944492 RepID=A0ABY4P0L5_9PSEU|nr:MULTISPECIES: ectoine/hydroxyectoine ABC transporter permease subunit EhuD [Amycolatopsis]OXM64586.1 ectoine/hydroxyectoine ABC transporter permease subunit EhuD [Amycolatopsis sp. KNN50.9b]UQS25879.1 ectoine/hydroxyectoine ABC transporter permease subunit EhuD [Amycolatopsis thermalba]
MVWDWNFAFGILPELLRGLWVTVQVTLAGIVIALVVGLVVAVLRHLRIPVLRQILWFYVEFVRGTPLLVQAYFAFYVLPLYGITFSAMVTGIIVIGLNYSAYTAEVYRAGIESVPSGQWEAATALSLPWRRRWQAVVLPQAVRAVVPALGNYLMQMFKDSAILSAITVLELLGHATAIGSGSYRYLEPYTLVGLLFLLVSYPAAKLIRRLELRLAQPR